MSQPGVRPWRRHTWIAGLWLAACTAGAASTACRVPILYPPLAREELVAAALTSNVFARSRDDLADLRVLNDAGQPVPFVLENQETREQTLARRDCPMSTPQARERDDQALELAFALPTNGVSPTGLTVDTPLRNFRQRVRVEGAADAGAWQVLADGAMLYDLARFVDVRQCDVSWAPNACRRFRVTFFDATRDRPDDVREVTSGTAGTNVRQNVRSEPFRVQAVRYWRTVPVESRSIPVLTAYSVTLDAAASQPAKGLFVFRSAREPLTRLVLATPSRLFHRSYRLYGRNGPEEAMPDDPGRLLASGTLTQIRFQEIARTEMTIDFPVSRCREYVLVCETGVDEAAEITVARAEGMTMRVIFAATPELHYALSFADAAAYPSMPESSTIQTLLANGCHPIAASLGAGPSIVAATRPWRAWLNNSTVMIGAMVIAGLLLALMLVQAGRKLK